MPSSFRNVIVNFMDGGVPEEFRNVAPNHIRAIDGFFSVYVKQEDRWYLYPLHVISRIITEPFVE